MNNRFTITDLFSFKTQGKPIAAVSCYDYATARLAAQAGIEVILVGDSAAQVVLGFDSTLPATMDFMVAITAAVRRGAPDALLVADMPFLSYQVTVAEAVKNAGRFAVEAGVQIIKIEVTVAHLDVIKAVNNAGMAVMAHIGIKPQSIGKSGKFRAEATTAEQAAGLIELAEEMVKAGACSLLLEGMSAEVAKVITEQSKVPVIGCGSGPYCDGQILIAPDILGLIEGRKPKFAKSYADLAQPIVEAFRKYASDIQAGKFPDEQHSYHMKPGELEQLKKIIK
jgi:3-methyl-2-oxobutanoate hydroxymethyltransferase